jgi:hypothetical protein
MSSPAIAPKCLARDIGLIRREGCYINPQFRVGLASRFPPRPDSRQTEVRG